MLKKLKALTKRSSPTTTPTPTATPTPTPTPTYASYFVDDARVLTPLEEPTPPTAYELMIARLCESPDKFPGLPHSIPAELWALVLGFVNIGDLGRLALTCTTFHHLSSDETINPMLRFQQVKAAAFKTFWGKYSPQEQHQQQRAVLSSVA
eukprot:TRINITY_DN8467_c0_g1_i1.p1 TRINITY_DN8467_c0_g1~~TRINITY_DN8467_c0_g1_i1.p1  ORF type:complete len:151 (-),score=35.84 TRINITY_DN8467_c0_g1_i1:58-510(-)